MHVPNAQPPQPFDWEPRPTHPVHHVPYQVAAAWELRVRADVDAKAAAAARQKQKQTQTLGDEAVAGRVPRELFLRAKKTPAVRAWVRTLEEPVRQYLVDRRVARAAAEDEASSEEDTEDEEIVFVGRNGTTMRDGWKKARREVPEGDAEEGIVLDALGDDDESGAFKYVTKSRVPRVCPRAPGKVAPTAQSPGWPWPPAQPGCCPGCAGPDMLLTLALQAMAYPFYLGLLRTGFAVRHGGKSLPQGRLHRREGDQAGPCAARAGSLAPAVVAALLEHGVAAVPRAM